MQELTVEELHTKLQNGDRLTLVDVREPEEVAHGMLPNAVHIPLGSLPQRMVELSTDSPIVVYCHHGARSARAITFLESVGIDGASNLTGGIDAWSRRIDPSLPTY